MLLGPSSVLASCTPLRPHDNAARYAITAATIGSLTGVSASILEYSPGYSGFNQTGTNATMMLATSGLTKWAQWGWFKSQIQTPGTTQRQVGLEFYVSASDNTYLFWAGLPLGSSNPYRLWYTSSFYDFSIGGTMYASFNGIPAPTDYQIFGETHDKADQMPGGSSAHETFTLTTYYTGASHVSHTVTSAIHTDSSYGATNPSSGRFDIWDWACTT